jgi:hypothetical protein
MASWNEDRRVATVERRECRTVSDEACQGWRAHRGDVPNGGPAPIVVFYCSECAERGSGSSTFGRRGERRISPED